MASIEANGITIAYEDEGRGEPLLLVMGLGGQLTDWPPDFVELLLEAEFRVIRIDNRDAGLSSEIDGPPLTGGQLARIALTRSAERAPYVIDDMAADAVALLDALGIDAAHVVGESMGGMIVQAMAIEHPARVRSLTSIMSTPGNRAQGRPKLSVIRKLARVARNASRETAVESGVELLRTISGPGFDEHEAREMGRISIERSYRPEAMGRQIAAMVASPDRTDGLALVRMPTLVVHGLLDPLVRPKGGIATARAVPGSRLLMFNDMGHDLPRARRPEIVDAIARNAARA